MLVPHEAERSQCKESCEDGSSQRKKWHTLRRQRRGYAHSSDWKLTTTSHNPEYAANDTGGWKQRVPGVQDCAGRFQVKATDDRHCPVNEGDAVALQLHVDATGDNYYDVPAIIEKIVVDVNISKGEIIAYLIDFAGSGPLVKYGVVGPAAAT